MATHGQDGGAGAGASDAPPVYTGHGRTTRAIDRVMDWIESVTMWVASISVLVMMLIVTISVIGRSLATAKIFGVGLADIGIRLGPIPDDTLLQGLLMVAIIALPFAFIHRRDGHIAVTITTDWLKPRPLAALRIFGGILALAFFFIIGWAIARDIPTDYLNKAVYDGVFELPAWPMKVVFTFGIAAFLLRIAFGIVVSIIDMIEGTVSGRPHPPLPEDI